MPPSWAHSSLEFKANLATIAGIMSFKIANKTFTSRLFLGTGKFSSNEVMEAAIKASGSELVTLALKRMDLKEDHNQLISAVKRTGANLLPNTSGARDAKEAILAAKLAREALETNWLKLEIHPDSRYLLPDPIETYLAAKELVKEGFIVMPYIQADPVLCKRLEDIGVQCVMPLGAPIGSNRGLETKAMLEIIIAQSNVPVIVDAGIGKPSHAVDAIELGADAVLVNTAIATAGNPVLMATAFKEAIESAIKSKESIPPQKNFLANASSPLTNFLQ